MENEVNREDLEAFILDDDLERLEKELSKFNLFDVLNSTHNELIHSAVLRWLLDPLETHGLTDYFLKTFLKRVVRMNPGHPHLMLSTIDIDVIDFDNSQVQSEEVFSNKRRGDISITNEENKLYILIENKVYSREGSQTTTDYVKETEKKYPGYKKIYIFLTPEGWAPESEKFLTFAYSDLIEVIDNVLTSKGEEMNNNTKFILEQLKRNVEANIVNKSPIDDLCLKIYEKHKKAIDKIFEVRPGDKRIYDSLGNSVISELKDDWKHRPTNSYCMIYRESWKNKFNPNSSFPFFHYEFYDISSGRIRIAIHIERLGDQDLRELLKNELKKTNIVGRKDIKLERGQVILVKTSVDKIDNIDEDVAINRGKDDMIKLIRETSKYLDEASGKMSV